MLSRWRIHTGTRLALVLACILGFAAPGLANPGGKQKKLDSVLDRRASRGGKSQVIVTVLPGADADVVSRELKKLGGKAGRRLDIVHSFTAELPNQAISKLAEHPGVFSIHYDRPTNAHMNRVAATVGARTVHSLALVAEVVHGAPHRFADPARFSLAHGGKDRQPFPVPVAVYDRTIAVLRAAVDKAKLGNEERLEALRRLDREARRLERHAAGPGFVEHVARERDASHDYGGRSVFGWEPPPGRGTGSAA